MLAVRQPFVLESTVRDGIEFEEGVQPTAEQRTAFSYTDVQQLRLSFRGLTRLDNLPGLASLRDLRLDNNDIHVISNLNHLVSLTRLDLSFNKIAKIQGLNGLSKLEDLSLYQNNISVVENLEELTALQCLSLGRNRIQSIDSIVYLRALPNLRILTFAGCPVTHHPVYHSMAAAHLPLKYLDNRHLSASDVEAAHHRYQDALTQLKAKENQEAAAEVAAQEASAFSDRLKAAHAETTVNILARLVEEEEHWAKLSGVPGLTDGWQGLAGTLEASLLEFQTNMLEQREARDQEMAEMQAAAQEITSTHAKDASKAIYDFSKEIKQAIRDTAVSGESRAAPKAELAQANLDMQKSLVAAELGVLNDVLSMATKLERALGTTAEACQPIINTCFGVIRKHLGEYWEGLIKFAPTEFQRYEVGECDTDTLPEASRPLMQEREALMAVLTACQDRQWALVDEVQAQLETALQDELSSLVDAQRTTAERRKTQRLSEIVHDTGPQAFLECSPCSLAAWSGLRTLAGQSVLPTSHKVGSRHESQPSSSSTTTQTPHASPGSTTPLGLDSLEQAEASTSLSPSRKHLTSQEGSFLSRQASLTRRRSGSLHSSKRADRGMRRKSRDGPQQTTQQLQQQLSQQLQQQLQSDHQSQKDTTVDRNPRTPSQSSIQSPAEKLDRQASLSSRSRNRSRKRTTDGSWQNDGASNAAVMDPQSALGEDDSISQMPPSPSSRHGTSSQLWSPFRSGKQETESIDKAPNSAAKLATEQALTQRRSEQLLSQREAELSRRESLLSQREAALSRHVSGKLNQHASGQLGRGTSPDQQNASVLRSHTQDAAAQQQQQQQPAPGPDPFARQVVNPFVRVQSLTLPTTDNQLAQAEEALTSQILGPAPSGANAGAEGLRSVSSAHFSSPVMTKRLHSAQSSGRHRQLPRGASLNRDDSAREEAQMHTVLSFNREKLNTMKSDGGLLSHHSTASFAGSHFPVAQDPLKSEAALDLDMVRFKHLRVNISKPQIHSAPAPPIPASQRTAQAPATTSSKRLHPSLLQSASLIKGSGLKTDKSSKSVADEWFGLECLDLTAQKPLDARERTKQWVQALEPPVSTKKLGARSSAASAAAASSSPPAPSSEKNQAAAKRGGLRSLFSCFG
ncbi:hypothetical protein WJX73_002320 [Symbiochloris irregularis]|uniref:Dynein regulatory complex subunit 3 n=1 Tax=Symbiochloris irregularis TaxID=706552 RepID=A0AAW1NQB1_9CHLO